MSPRSSFFLLDRNEDSREEEDEPMDANHLGKGILNNSGKIGVDDKEDELPDIQETDEDGEERGRVQGQQAFAAVWPLKASFSGQHGDEGRLPELQAALLHQVQDLQRGHERPVFCDLSHCSVN